MADSSSQNVHAGHRARMRSLVENVGLERLNQHQILEYLLFFTIPRINTNPLAHGAVKKFKTVGNALTALPKELMDVKGIGLNSAVFLSALGNFYVKFGFSAGTAGVYLSNAFMLSAYFRRVFEESGGKSIAVAFCGNNREVLRCLTFEMPKNRRDFMLMYYDVCKEYKIYDGATVTAAVRQPGEFVTVRSKKLADMLYERLKGRGIASVEVYFYLNEPRKLAKLDVTASDT